MGDTSLYSWINFGAGALQGFAYMLGELGKNVQNISGDYIKRDQETKNNLSTWTSDIETKFTEISGSIKGNYSTVKPLLERLINQSTDNKYIYELLSNNKLKIIFSLISDGILLVECFRITNDFKRDTYVSMNILPNGVLSVNRGNQPAQHLMFWLHELLTFFLNRFTIPND